MDIEERERIEQRLNQSEDEIAAEIATEAEWQEDDGCSFPSCDKEAGHP